ncbi:MAG: methyltransferase domain-containing protein [Atopobiaceae bacterium]|nr:class I SAM-dependent methyltransferase [Atopobiaceae bacterium]MCH4181003.1 class I SAM-dependent methyltransferase [Atopobiaceae bacterium]MCH4214915.1 class I SAM-dependent methyltransferase [Atopobiaceae bacterium]MCH4229757.1 class I SAM-dependent methyltransferase [Atopobiaceae bacterium]MCH4276046.1 class I SAM-dependent methyltransferase [Atopobiaceae bacterium]
MFETFRQVPLYRFLGLAEEAADHDGLPRVVLDCGAGGNQPPLALFAHAGYETHGIDLSDSAIAAASSYEVAHSVALGIERGDMCQLPLSDGCMPFVYSYNSVFHMRKSQVRMAVAEMVRVLAPGGLLFVNFLTTADQRYGTGEPVEDAPGGGEYWQEDDGSPVIHSYYAPREPAAMLDGLEPLWWEDRTLERPYEGATVRQGFVDYVVRKPLPPRESS